MTHSVRDITSETALRKNNLKIYFKLWLPVAWTNFWKEIVGMSVSVESDRAEPGSPMNLFLCSDIH